MYWPCQRGYLFGELVTYAPAKRGVPGSTRPAGTVSPCDNGVRNGTTKAVHVWNSGRKRAAPFVQLQYCGHIREQGGWKRLLHEWQLPIQRDGWKKLWESSRCGLSMLYSNCVVVRTLTVLAVPGVLGRTLIWQGARVRLGLLAQTTTVTSVTKC